MAKSYVHVFEMERSAEPESPRSGVSFEENSILGSRGWGEAEPRRAEADPDPFSAPQSPGGLRPDPPGPFWILVAINSVAVRTGFDIFKVLP